MSPARLVDAAARTLTGTFVVVIALSALAIWGGELLRLTIAGAIGLYFVVWWTMLFAILPVRVRSLAETGEVLEGSDPGAPAQPALRERAIWTTVVSLVVFLGVAAFFPLAGL